MTGGPLPDARAVSPPDGDLLILECDRPLSHEQHRRLVEHFERLGTGRKVLVLDAGIRVSAHQQLDRMEAKLDAIVSALAAEDAPAVTLDGHPAGSARNGTEEL